MLESLRMGVVRDISGVCMGSSGFFGFAYGKSSGTSTSRQSEYLETLPARISAAMLRDRNVSRTLQKQPVIIKTDANSQSCRNRAA